MYVGDTRRVDLGSALQFPSVSAAIMSSFAKDLRCPDDAHMLHIAIEGRVTFAVCRHCDGVWFSREAIEGPDTVRLPEPANRPRKNKRAADVRRCAQCAVPLDAEDVDGVVIDVCPQCGGVWLDPGEYQAARRRSARISARAHRPVPQGQDVQSW